MFIGICGPKCAGKSTVAQYLVDHHGFAQLHLAPSADEGDAAAGPAGDHTFPTAAALLDFVTPRWRSRWVTTAIPSEAALDAYSQRPFFLLISVDAPTTVRWRRFLRRGLRRGQTTTAQQPPPQQPPPQQHTTLEAFVARSDAALYAPATGLAAQLSRASLRLLNTPPTVARLHTALDAVDLASAARLRPSWDSYFMSLAALASRRSNCMKRAVGCVVVSRQHRRVLSTGYNGTPRGAVNCSEGGCGRCNSNNSGGGGASGAALATCRCLHAEENALLEVGRERIAREGGVLYCDTCPCLTCSVKIVQVGIEEVVYSRGYSMDEATAEVLRGAGVRLRQFSPPANGLIHLESMDLSPATGDVKHAAST